MSKIWDQKSNNETKRNYDMNSKMWEKSKLTYEAVIEIKYDDSQHYEMKSHNCDFKTYIKWLIIMRQLKLIYAALHSHRVSIKQVALPPNSRDWSRMFWKCQTAIDSLTVTVNITVFERGIKWHTWASESCYIAPVPFRNLLMSWYHPACPWTHESQMNQCWFSVRFSNSPFCQLNTE